MNKKCPFCGGDKLKFESNNSNKGLSLKEKYAGYRSRITGSIRCNRCFSRGPTKSIISKGITPSKDELNLLESIVSEAWDNRTN